MSAQLAFVVRRLLLTIPMLFIMSIVVFLIIRLVPGDPVRTMLGFRATDENVAELHRQLGLDRPWIEQYMAWASALLRGDLGQDIVSRAPLSELLWQRLPVTLELTALSMSLAVFVGVPLGIRAATGGRWSRALTEGFVVVGVSIPAIAGVGYAATGIVLAAQLGTTDLFLGAPLLLQIYAAVAIGGSQHHPHRSFADFR